MVVRALLMGAITALAGCADPMSHTDGLFPDAGSAQLRNLSSQTIGPAYGYGANPGGFGPRAVQVIQDYQTGDAPAASPAPAVAAAPAT